MIQSLQCKAESLQPCRNCRAHKNLVKTFVDSNACEINDKILELKCRRLEMLCS